ncbi:hypothetical protein [Hydrogenophaga sp. ANAO-22]|uniref:hypothetical protein n=1 Tax=Hydrogenophaga sp. ANAO-22 TaxID=3166645 RepID=UPI0036D327A2
MNAGISIDLRIGQHVRHRDYKGKRVTGVVHSLSVDREQGLMVEIILDEPIVIDGDGERPINIHRQYAPAHEFQPFDDRDELIAELRLACEGLLSCAETGTTSLSAIRAGQAAIAKATGTGS